MQNVTSAISGKPSVVNLRLFLHLNFALGQRVAPITDHYIGDATAFGSWAAPECFRLLPSSDCL